MSILDTAGQTAAAPAQSFETVRELQTDPDDSRTRYGVDKRTSDGTLHLVVERDRKDKDASVKRLPLAPVARALTMGVID